MKIFTPILLVILCLLQTTAQIFINEVQTSNDATILDNFLESDDWIELYNPTGTAIDIAGYYISDDRNDLLQHQIITGNAALSTIPANGYLLLWADDDAEQGAHHLNFKLKAGGETIYLTSADQVSYIDSLQVPAVATDESFFRKPDGSNNLYSSPTPTPAASNNNVTLNLNEPLISLPSGKYNGTQTVSLTADAGATIHYTTDGSSPTTNSTIYNGPFNVINSATVKAFAIKPGYINSKTIFESYIIGATTNLSIVNISINPDYLYNDQIGMYTEGSNGLPGPCLDTPANWWQDFEYQATVTLYEENGDVGFSEACGIQLSGGCSRNKEKKSFNVKFKSEYGKKNLNYQLFEGTDVDLFDGFKLRNGGSPGTMRIQDAFAQKTMENQFDIDMQYSRPVALYLNNEYWGLYHIRDRINSGYLQSHHSKVDHDNVDLIKLPNADGAWFWWATQDVKSGDAIAYNNMHNFAVNNNLSIAADYNTVINQLDYNELTNYLISHIYLNNGDWPENNVKIWRERTEKGKWRWTFYDVDFMYWWRGGYKNTALFDELMNETNPAERRNPKATELFRSLFKNESFKNEFAQRMNTYIHTVWDYNRTNSLFLNMKNGIANEVQADFSKWGGWNFNEWNTEVNKLDTYFRDRPAYARTMVKNVLGLSDLINLNFNATTNGTLLLHQNFFEVPANFAGTYFKDMEMYLHGIPKPGYRFVEWVGINDANYKYKQNIYKPFENNKTITPVFEPGLDVVINEIYYNPAGTKEDEEFIEIYNPDDKAKSLWGYQFTDGVEFQFPENTIIQPDEYIVIARNDSAYVNKGYQVFEWTCGSLNNDGESIVFTNLKNEMIDSVRYNDNAQWNQSADGLGFSLALLDGVSDNNLPNSWEEQVPAAAITPGSKNDFCGIGTPCDDGNPESINDAIDANCNCTGIIEDVCNTIGIIENFETSWGIWNDGGSDARRDGNSSYAASGSYSAAIQDNTGSSVITTNTIDLAAYTEIEVNFNYYAVSMDNSSEDFWLQISTNGGSNFSTIQTWAKTIHFNNNIFYSESVNIKGPFTTNTKLRFRCDASGDYDDVYIDDIEIIACSSGGNTCATVGQTCSDGDACTINDEYDANCNCVGMLVGDFDNDGICDVLDNTNGNCTLNASCDDGDACTVGETYNANCNCTGGTVTGGGASAEILTPTDDTFIRGGTYAGNNYGNSTTMHTKKAGNDKWTRYGYLKYDLSAVDANQLQSATFRIKVSSNNNGGVSQELLLAPSDNWTETTLTWNNNQFGGSSISNFTVAPAGQWIEIEVTNAVQTEALADGVVSFAITSNNNSYVKYYTKESTGNTPELVLNYQGCANNRLGKIEVEGINIYPNPASDYLNVEISGDLSMEYSPISIFNASGKLISVRNVEPSQRIFVGDLKAGLYVLRVQNDGIALSGKFIKN